jgi:hypothetical protein
MSGFGLVNHEWTSHASGLMADPRTLISGFAEPAANKGSLWILCLLIQTRTAKTSGIMKTLSGTFAFVVLAVIVIVTLPSCDQTRKIVPNQKFLLIIKDHTPGKKYVNWTTEDKFDEALKQLCQNGGKPEISKLKEDGGQPYPGKTCKELIETVKVTKSKAADGAAAGESAGDPNVTYRIAATNKEDILNVLSELK